MILLDFSSIMMSSVMTRIHEFEDNVDMIRHQVYNMIRMYNQQYSPEYGQMVLCMDGGKNWRKDFFPPYKANRKKARKESKHDWKPIFDMINEVREEIKVSVPYKCVHVDRCEADDVIATICEKHMTPEPILIISPDKDFIQLQRYPNVKQWSNLQKKWIEPDVSPEHDLAIKVLKGDTGDGVPNVMSEDEVLMEEGKRQTPLSKKKIEQLINDPEAFGTSVARRIIRNRTLIDLRRTPEDIKEEIIEQYNQRPKGDMMKLLNVFTKHQMKLLAESLQDFQ